MVLQDGDVFYLNATAYPSNTNKFTWSTSNSKIVSVNSSGKITANSPGAATITAKTSDGRKKEININVSGVTVWQTGEFDNGHVANGYTAIKLNKNAGDGYIKIYTYNALGSKTNGEIHITLKDLNGNWICEFDAKSGDKLRLGNNYDTYRVYIAHKTYTNDNWGKDFNNIGNCKFWAIECTNNCYIDK